MSFDHIHPSLHTSPYSWPTQIYVFFSFFHLSSPICALQVFMGVTVHWSVVNLPGNILKEIHSPSPSSY